MIEKIHLKAFKITHLNDVVQGLVDTNPQVCGNWRKSWAMQLRFKGVSFKMPRGFKANFKINYFNLKGKF